MNKLNLGCGEAWKVNYVNVDKVDLEGVDVIHDLNIFPYPFNNEEFDIIRMDDILEHLDNPIDVLQECWRILKKGGKCILRVVYWNHYNSYSDPQHKWAFTEKYFDFFIGARNPYYMEHHFKSVEIKHHFDSMAINKYGYNECILLEKAHFHCNIIEGMEVTLIK